MINYKGFFLVMQNYVTANVSFRYFHGCIMFHFAQTNQTLLPYKTPYFSLDNQVCTELHFTVLFNSSAI